MRDAGKVVLSLAMVIGWLFMAGCDSRPQAPELVNSPVYHNKAEGFRFRVPEGWTQTANANLPPGDFEGENFLVRYLVRSPASGSTLQVLCLVDNASIDLEEHYKGGSFGVETWKLTQPAKAVDLRGIAAEHIEYEGTLQGKTMHKEVLCVRRGNRVYSFIGLYFDGDEKARLAIDSVLDSLIWEK